MATTDPLLAVDALAALTDAGISFALLHGQPPDASVTISDLDLLVGESPTKIIQSTRSHFAARGLHPVAVTVYDLGGTRSVWYSTENADGGVQVDLLYDPQGHGRQGLRGSGLLLWTDFSAQPPRLRPEAELIYLWRKRIWKGQIDRLPDLRKRAAAVDQQGLIEASISIVGTPRTAHELLGISDPNLRAARWVNTCRHPILRTKRLYGRVVHPAGFWIHSHHQSVAHEVAQRFGRFLPHSITLQVRQDWMTNLNSLAMHIKLTQLRAGFVATYGPLAWGLKPDMVTDSSSPDDVSGAAVAAMSRRFIP